MTATRTAPKWLGDYIEELAELRFLPVDDAVETNLYPTWLEGSPAYAVAAFGSTVVTVTDHFDDERISVGIFDVRGWMLHEPLSFAATDLGMRFAFAVITALADA